MCSHAQFRALSDQLYCTPAHHGEVRTAAVAQLRACPDAYAPYVEGEWGDYVRDMARLGTWGDHVTLQVGPLLAPVRGTLHTSGAALALGSRRQQEGTHGWLHASPCRLGRSVHRQCESHCVG